LRNGLTFEWDAEKAAQNRQKHGVSFEEASAVFGDVLSVTIHDAVHSTFEETRFVTVGLSEKDRLIVVVHCERNERIRIISARRANKLEKQVYEEGFATQGN